MPNWCGNKLIIDVSDCEKGNEFEEKLVWLKIHPEMPETENGFFDYMCPSKDYIEKEEDRNTISGNGDLYGTKWDIDIPDVSSFDEYDKDFCGGTEIFKDDEGRYVILFKTAWRPATGFVDLLAKRNKGMEITLLFCEAGLQFCGAYYAGGHGIFHEMKDVCEVHNLDMTDKDEDGFWNDDYIDEVLEVVGDEVGESFSYIDYGG